MTPAIARYLLLRMWMEWEDLRPAFPFPEGHVDQIYLDDILEDLEGDAATAFLTWLEARAAEEISRPYPQTQALGVGVLNAGHDLLHGYR